MINKFIKILEKNINNFQPPLVEQIIKEYSKNPFLILISCLLSLRSKDSITIHICRKLFSIAKTPKEILELQQNELEKLIYKIGFYKNKSKVLLEVSNIILQKFNGKVPNTMEKLLSIKGVGRKTANLVLGLAFDVPSIIVDIHVHRISNRMGIIQTKDTLQSELELQKILPKKYWTEWNKLLVMWGQNICRPISPKCSKCALNKICKKIGVLKHR